jgi:RNA polymerase sigma-70 factor (ECF subfamily)
MLKNIARGDKEALEELYNSMSKDIYTFLLMFCKDKYTAEDVLQETFIAIYENAASYRVYNNPRAWIFTIAKNKALNIIKKDSRMTSIETLENDIADTAENIENIILDKIQADMLLSVLSEKDKKIVILHAVYGFKHREIAELMSLPLDTVTRRYKESIAKKKKKSGEGDEIFLKINKKEVLQNEK